VTGSGFTPGGAVTFAVDFLNGFSLSGYDSTTADAGGGFTAKRLNGGFTWACSPIDDPQQAEVTATDVTTGLSDTTTVDLPC
jgi:hypothetical protein